MTADTHHERDVVAEAARVQPLADDVLTPSGGEAVGRVHRVAAELDVGVEDVVTGLEVDVPAELGTAEDQGKTSMPLSPSGVRTFWPTGGPWTGMGADGCTAGVTERTISGLDEESVESTPKKAMCHPHVDSHRSLRDRLFRTPGALTMRVWQSGQSPGR
nr:hypothetical protein GCM10025699_22370 [Microbacterium flavescens]